QFFIEARRKREIDPTLSMLRGVIMESPSSKEKKQAHNSWNWTPSFYQEYNSSQTSHFTSCPQRSRLQLAGSYCFSNCAITQPKMKHGGNLGNRTRRSPHYNNRHLYPVFYRVSLQLFSLYHPKPNDYRRSSKRTITFNDHAC
ncbi:MAG: hypothetical protein ACI8XC_000489, partial [Gammaproteobacteria bacterium]